MSASLIAAIRKNRELKAVIGKWTFICQRPTDVEAAILLQNFAKISEEEQWRVLMNAAMQHVTGWEGVIEDDIVAGGGTDAIVFEASLWREWCADRRDFWAPIGGKCIKAWQDHLEALKAAEKNSSPA